MNSCIVSQGQNTDWILPIYIYHVNRVILTVCEHIVAKDTFVQLSVGVYKPAGFRVVVAALEIV